MSRYSYTLHGQGEWKSEYQNTYLKAELEAMTIYQLREICRKERLVKVLIADLNQEELVRLILRYRGRKCYRIINKPCQGGLERINAAICGMEQILQNSKSIRVPTRLTFYEEAGVDITDGYQIESSQELFEGNMLLVNQKRVVYGVCYLKRTVDGNFYLQMAPGMELVIPEEDHWSMWYVSEDISEYLYDCYYDQPRQAPTCIVYETIALLDVSVLPMEKSDIPLVIDFGTCNTTAGTYHLDGRIESVQVVNHLANQFELTSLIPSVIGVAYGQKEQMEFSFGYDALVLERLAYADEMMPVFYDMKRWMNDVDRIESRITIDGVRHPLIRKALLREYLNYVIRLSEHYFHKKFSSIQILAPIKHKEKHEHIYKSLLPEYQVEILLDEGMAILYQSIKQLIKQNQYEPDQWYRALVLDCGGGTSELTSCRFQIGNNRISYVLSMETALEHGDANFGGNNLTYEIMQLLKKKLAETISGGSVTSEEAESILPTCFGKYENQGTDVYFKVQNNFYYLFETAEEIKQHFFRDGDVYEIRLKTEPGVRRSLYLDKWRLFIWKDGKLQSGLKELEAIFYLFEVENQIKPGIYGLMERCLSHLFASGELMDYDLIKLTGQSSFAPLFLEALKEFVPGRSIQKMQGNKEERKLCPLYGVLEYLRDIHLGYLKAKIQKLPGVSPYSISACNHENKEQILLPCLEKSRETKWIARFKAGEQIDLTLRDSLGNQMRVYHYQYQVRDFTKVIHEELAERYQNKVIQEETDHMINGELRFFVWPADDAFGFYLLPVLRENDDLYEGSKQYFEFEDDTWELHFFDGDK